MVTRRPSRTGRVIQCHPRAYFTRRGVHLFLHTWRSGVVPRCWVFAPRWAFDPFLAQAEIGIDAQELVLALGASADPPPVVSVGGKPQRARFRPFHGDVVIVSSLGGEIQSLPISNLIHRLPDVQVLLLRLRLPVAAGATDDAGPLREHWRAELAGGQALFGLHRPGGRCTIAGVSFPCLILGTGDLTDSSLEEMQQFWDRLLAPLFGACTLCDTGASDGPRYMFVQHWSLPGRLPWISRLPTGVDVVVADPGGAGLDDPVPGYDWHLRPVLRSTWFGFASYTAASCTGLLAPFQQVEGVLPAVLETPSQPPAHTNAVSHRLPWAHDAASAEHTSPPVSVHASSGTTGSASQRRSQLSSQQASTDQSGTVDTTPDAYGSDDYAAADLGALPLQAILRATTAATSAGQDDTLAHPHHSLLHISSRLTRDATASSGTFVEADADHPVCLRVWTQYGQALPIVFAPDAQVGEVSALLARALGPSHGAHSLYPVFPAVEGEFHCVSTAELESAADLLVFVTGPAVTSHRVCTISVSDRGKELFRKLGCPTGALYHGDRRWSDPSQGAFHGMHLRLQPEAGRHPLRAVATPCRNVATGLGHGKIRHVVNLQEAIPPPQDGVAFGLDADMVADMLSAHCPPALRLFLPPAVGLHPVARSTWDALPSWQPARPVDALYIFTDGSFHPHTRRSTWAVVCLVVQDGHVHKLGCLCDACSAHDIEGLGAFAGEVEALLHAHAIAAAANCRQTHIGSDCTSALLACSGQCGSPPALADVDATLGMAHLAEGKGVHIIRHKVEAHSGCAFNEMADSLVKAIARHGGELALAPCHDHLVCSVQDRTAQWAWLFCKTRANDVQLPFLSARGTWLNAAAVCQPSTFPVEMGFGQAADPLVATTLRLTAVQYNCLSLKGGEAVQMMQSGLRRQQVHLAGLQETRTRWDGISQQGDFWVVSSPCNSQRVGGCQLWLSKNRGVGNSGQAVLKWNRQSFALLVRDPQLLVVLAKAGGVKLALVSGHAPTAKAPEDVRQAWWDMLASALRRVPATYAPLLMLDANARFCSDPSSPSSMDSQPDGRNAESLQALCGDFGLSLSRLTRRRPLIL